MNPIASVPTPLRVVFWGQDGGFSRVFLEALPPVCQVVAVVEAVPTGALKPSRWWRRSALQRFARRHRIPWIPYHPQHQAEALRRLTALPHDLGVVASFPCLLKPLVLALPRRGMLNVHPSLLPAFRGPSPWAWHYLTLAAESGVTIHRVTPEEDAGEVLGQVAFSLERGLPLKRFRERVYRHGVPLLQSVLRDLAAGTLRPRPQPSLEAAVRARRLHPAESPLDAYADAWPLEDAFHVACGLLEEHPPQALRSGWRRWLAWRPVEPEAVPAPVAAGRVGLDRRGFYLAHAEGRIRLAFSLSPKHVARNLLRRSAPPRQAPPASGASQRVPTPPPNPKRGTHVPR